MARGVGVMVAAAGVALVLAGCDSSTPGTPAPVTPTMAAEAPTGFKPCEDIPQSVLDSERLVAESNDDQDGPNGVKWRGCGWVQPDGYSPSIRTTNITLAQLRERGIPDLQEFTIGGRAAISGRQTGETSCVINIELKGGSLELLISYPPVIAEKANKDSCVLGTTLAEKIVPLIPQDV